jgi:hypothetical protein
MSASPNNTAYTAHFVRPNFGYAETSYTLGTLSEMRLKGRDSSMIKVYVDTSVFGGFFDAEFKEWSNKLME